MASKIYTNPETSFVWGESGGGGVTKLLDLGGLTASTGIACGAYQDLGAGPRADLYEVEMYIDGFSAGTLVAGTSLDLFFIQSNDGTNFDGSPTTAPTSSVQGTVAINEARNGYYAVSALCHTNTQGQTLRVRCVCRFTARYIAPVVINRTAGTLKSSSDNHRVIVTPIPYESQ